MKQLFLHRHLLVAALTFSAAGAFAAPIVASGSSYDAVVFSSSGQTNMLGMTFDGVAETVTGGGRTVTINDSQQDLGGGTHRVSFVFSADSDLYPTPGENGYVNIGLSSNPLELLRPVDLIAGILRVYDAVGSLFATGNFLDPTVQSWDGYWLASGIAGGVINLGGRDIRRVELDLELAEIPEPGTALLALAALGLASIAARRNGVRRSDPA